MTKGTLGKRERKQYSEKFETLLNTMRDLGFDEKIDAINEGMGDVIIERLMEKLEEVLLRRCSNKE